MVANRAGDQVGITPRIYGRQGEIGTLLASGALCSRQGRNCVDSRRYDIAFRCKARLRCTSGASETELRARLKTPENFCLDRSCVSHLYDDFGNICTRLVLPGVLKLSNRLSPRQRHARASREARQAKVRICG